LSQHAASSNRGEREREQKKKKNNSSSVEARAREFFFSLLPGEVRGESPIRRCQPARGRVPAFRGDRGAGCWCGRGSDCCSLAAVDGAAEPDAMLLSCGSLSSWVRRFVACVGGCFGCAQPTPIIAVDQPSKGLRIQGRSVKRRNLSDDFWSSSPHDMENSALQSRHSMSSISTAAQPNDQLAAGSSSNPNEFVNQGLLIWHQTRQQWIGKRRRNSQGQQSQEPKISHNATYESLLGSTKPFPQPIPLAEMVDFLVISWEQEGLYD
ncbi:unnamed protein product, partial [Urochloa humidicola]